MSWAHSLIRLSTYEAEVLQRRLAEIVERRIVTELRRAMLEAEGEAEASFLAGEAAIYRASFLDGLRHRKAAVQAEITVSLTKSKVPATCWPKPSKPRRNTNRSPNASA